MKQPGHWFKFFLAHQLRLTVAGVEQMTLAEFHGWRAYFEAEAKRAKQLRGRHG
jgi:hypothetical protein